VNVVVEKGSGLVKLHMEYIESLNTGITEKENYYRRSGFPIPRNEHQEEEQPN